MSFKDYLRHYLDIPEILIFFLVSLILVMAIHFILICSAKIRTKDALPGQRNTLFQIQFYSSLEKYYELMMSSSGVLFFTGIYFTLDYPALNSLLPYRVQMFWDSWDSFILLGFIVFSIILNSIFDHLFIPLHQIKPEEKSSLRMAGMIYMLIIFAYIKFIDDNSNYDSIIVYFLTMVIGRFVYFDASLKDFLLAMKSLFHTIPYLVLVLSSTALLAFHGFGSGYLLRSNGVVLSLFIAHFYTIIIIFIVNALGLSNKTSQKAAHNL